MIRTDGREWEELPRPVRRAIRHPWARWRRARLTRKQRRKMRRYLNKNGYVTPNFTWGEAASKDAARTPVPGSLRKNAIRHAWKLERFRHRVGDVPLSPLSWYRTPSHNRAVGGATQSRHMMADATDFPKAQVDRVGRSRWFAAANKVWAKGGVGDYPGGSAHMDSRGWRARWTSF